MPKPPFPSDLLTLESGSIAKNDGEFTISLKLARFSGPYPSQHDTEEEKWIDETLVTDSVSLPIKTLKELRNSEFDFPVNPESGYVEGFLYMWNVHNPVDFLRIRFGDLTRNGVTASFLLCFRFSYEGLCEDVEKELSTTLVFEESSSL